MAVTIKGFASDWSVPTPAQTALNALYIRGEYIAHTPLKYGAVGDGTVDDTAAVGSALQEVPAGGTVDLLGRTYRITSSLNIGKTVTVRNGTLTAENSRVAIITGANVRLDNVKFIRTGTGGRTGTDAALTINAAGATLVDVHAISTVGDGIRLANGNSNGFTSRGGRFESSDTNDTCGFQLLSGPAHNYDVKVSGATIRHTGKGTGIAFYNCSRSTVEKCDVRGIRASTWFYPSGWTLVDGTVYRVQDRPDTVSNAVYVNGVEYRKNSPASTTTPALNYYTTPGDGYLYINTGVDPNTQTVRTRRTNGYGILFYATSNETLGMADNLIAHNHVEDTDGFGIYYQTLMNVPKNNRTLQNTLRDVCKMGIAVGDLPFAAIGVFGGLNVLLEGDHVNGAGTTEYPCPGIDFKASTGTPHMTGKIRGATVLNATATGLQLAPGTWDVDGVTVEGSKVHGIGHGVISSTDNLSMTLTNCVSRGNTLSGAHIERGSASSGAFLKVTIIGGEYRNNQRNIVLARCQEVFIGSGVYSAGQSAYGISVGAFCSRVTIDGVTLNGQGVSVDSSVTDLFLGAVNHDGSAGTKLNVPIAYRVGGVKGYGSEMWVGPGTPEGAVAAPVGASYRRTDGGAGTTSYIKESGTGNTGWVAK